MHGCSFAILTLLTILLLNAEALFTLHLLIVVLTIEFEISIQFKFFIDLCLFVPCFPAFFDLLISLGQ